jgi:ribosomal protein S18 acetylase RimI-like enzyme
MKFERDGEREFPEIQKFYWDVIDGIHAEYPDNPKLGWGKGVYPTDAYLKEALSAGELYRLTEGDRLLACVILNNRANEGYAGCPWSLECAPQDILYVHTLAVHPSLQKKGIGKIVVCEIISLARRLGKKAIRLDVLSACREAERLYVACGFRFVIAKDMYYEDTGLVEYKMYELNL